MLSLLETYENILNDVNNPRLLQVLAAGVYFSSLIKDLICSPRPFEPTVTRLSELVSLVKMFVALLTPNLPSRWHASVRVSQ